MAQVADRMKRYSKVRNQMRPGDVIANFVFQAQQFGKDDHVQGRQVHLCIRGPPGCVRKSLLQNGRN